MKPALCLALLFSSYLSLNAQEPDPEPSATPEAARRGVWEAQMPAGTYFVKLGAITTVSMHEYVVDGAARVNEVTVSTVGSEIARFYYIEPNIPKPPSGIGEGTIKALEERGKQAVAKVGGEDVWRKVAKNYPTTTHAHTVEYRLESKESLDKLFASLQQAWLSGHATTFKP